MARWGNICTSKRAQAKSEFEKQFWKLMVRIQTQLFSIDRCCHSLKNQSTFSLSIDLRQFDPGFIIYQQLLNLYVILFQVNAVYGKTIENVFDRDIAKICRKKEHLLQHVTRGNYKRHVIINEDLVVVFLRQNFVYFNKPYYIGRIQIQHDLFEIFYVNFHHSIISFFIGFSILDISKTLMVDFWYLVLKKFYSNDISLLYSDTDSFIIRVRFLFG